jgi:uncharacterized repeat protein (TIGR01451 family)
VFSDDGLSVAFRSAASDLGATDTNSTGDIYVATLHAADLSVTATASPEPVATGHGLTYELHVTNAGPDPADDAQVALLLPEGIDLTGASSDAGACTPPAPAQPRLVVCPLGDVPAGGTIDATVTGDVTAAPGSPLVAVAAVRSATIDDDPTDDHATVATTVD